ncbi:hypothetical protein ACHAW6_002334 [Cyclotella cf. meneghiniana]
MAETNTKVQVTSSSNDAGTDREQRDDTDEFESPNNDGMTPSFNENSASGEQHSGNRTTADLPISHASVSHDTTKTVMSGIVHNIRTIARSSEDYALYGDSTLDVEAGDSAPSTRLPAMLTKLKLPGDGKEPMFFSVLKSKSDLIAAKTSKSWNSMIEEAQVSKLSALRMVPYFGTKSSLETDSFVHESSLKCRTREVSFDYQLMSDVDYSSAPRTIFLKQ